MSDIATRLEPSNGRWRVVWVDPKTKRRRVRNIGRMDEVGKKAAERTRREIEHDINNDPTRASATPSMTVSDWLERYLSLRGREVSAETVRMTREAATLFIETVGPHAQLKDLTTEDAARHRQVLSDRTYHDKPISPATVAKHIRHLRGLFGIEHGAVRFELIKTNPFRYERGLNPKIDKEVRYVSTDEIDKIVLDDPSDIAIALAIARFAGLRPNEIERLTWRRDVDLVNRWVHVPHTGRQTTKKRARTVPMSPRLYEILDDHHTAAVAGRVAVIELPRNNRYRIIRQVIKIAGVVPWDDVFKTLRKNIETDWMAEHPIMDVCKWLGHSPTVAQVHYHKARPEVMERVSKPTAKKADARQLAELIDGAEPAEWMQHIRVSTRDKIAQQIQTSETGDLH